MNTKMMKKHLEKCGIEFVKVEDQGWEARMDGDMIGIHTYLGEVIWEVAKELGED